MNVQGIKVGNVVNVSINGKLHKKNCGSPEEAKELYELVLSAKENPTEEAINAIRSYLNKKLRIAFLAGLEHDVETGEIFLAGFNTPIPLKLVDVIQEYYENEYPLDAIINFWKLLMVNPDTRVRESLFDFISTHDFVLTDKGYMVVYKAVYLKDMEQNMGLNDFVSNQYIKVKKNWKCSPNKYVVYQNNVTNEYNITKETTAEKWDDELKAFTILGKLGEMFETVIKSENAASDGLIYTDMYTQRMEIRLGEVVQMDRKDCDSDPAIDCSYGLHVGATSYVQNFASYNSKILVCLVNPANVVAVPNFDHSKIRVSEYFPYALATYINGNIDIIEETYFEEDYCNIEAEELEVLINKVKANEKPFEAAKNAEEETRPMNELMNILQSRLIDIADVCD